MTAGLGAILVAAGASQRMGFDKVWALLAGRPVLTYALDVLTGSRMVDRLVLVVAPNRQADAHRLVRDLGARVELCPGGARRRDSVAAGLELIPDLTQVLVHDAARPFLTERLIVDGIVAIRDADAAVAAVPLRDTLKRVEHGCVLETLPREQLWVIQTPQFFRTDVLARALRASDEDVTDEATLVEWIGGRVVVYAGCEGNQKLTTPADLDLAEARLAMRRARPARAVG